MCTILQLWYVRDAEKAQRFRAIPRGSRCVHQRFCREAGPGRSSHAMRHELKAIAHASNSMEWVAGQKYCRTAGEGAKRKQTGPLRFANSLGRRQRVSGTQPHVSYESPIEQTHQRRRRAMSPLRLNSSHLESTWRMGSLSCRHQTAASSIASPAERLQEINRAWPV